jgi:hypothetical protein
MHGLAHESWALGACSAVGWTPACWAAGCAYTVRILECVLWGPMRPVTILNAAKMADFSRSIRTVPDDT